MRKNQRIEQLKRYIRAKRVVGAVKIASPAELYCYKRKRTLSFALLSTNNLQEPVLVADYGKDRLSIFENYPSLRFYVDLSGERPEIYDKTKGAWTILDLSAVSSGNIRPKDGHDSFWLIAVMVGVAALVAVFIVAHGL